MKVYSPKDNHKIEKILFAAKLYGKQLTHEVVQYDTKIPKSFKEAYPAFSMPALQIQQGKYIFGTNTILLHLSLPSQKGSPFQKAKTIQYLQHLERDVEAATGILILKEKECVEVKETQLQKAKQILSQYGKELNDKLSIKTFFVGDKASIADISIFYNLKSIKNTMQKSWEKLKNLHRWMKHMESLVESV